MNDWLDRFVPFTAFHLVTVAVFGGSIAAACWLGRSWKETPREARFRRTWGWVVLAYQAWYTVWYLLPWNFTWEKSLPLQLCDLAAFVAGLAMVTRWRPWRTLLYFWGIGLSTQAFFTPIIQTGLASKHFWMFWIGHTMIVGSAVYDVIVCGYRPRARDLGFAFTTSLIYCLSMFYLDVLLTEELGRPISYAFMGPSAPDNPTIIDRLGPWPRRGAALMAIASLDYLLLWLVWPITGRLFGAASRD